MLKGFSSDITVNVIASIIASLVLLVAGFLWGKYKERRKYGRNLEEYDFYPFTINRENFSEFNLKDFRLGMHYFLKNNDYTAARQLIFIGEQNNVRAQLEPSEQKVYATLFEKYEGKKIADDTAEYLENYVRIVRLIGKSFPNSGIEILLHNLADPSHSLIALENNVTGRHLRDGTTNLLIPRSAVTRSDINAIELGIIGHCIPYCSAASILPPLAAPCPRGHLMCLALEPVVWVPRYRIEAPESIACYGIVGSDVAT